MTVVLSRGKTVGMGLGVLILGFAFIRFIPREPPPANISQPQPASEASLQKAEAYAEKQLEFFTPPPAVNEASPEKLAVQRVQTYKSLLVTLPKLDRSPYKTKFTKKIFEELDQDPGIRDLSLQILADPNDAQRLFGKDQGMARVIAIDYLGYLDSKAPQDNHLIKALELIHKRLEQNSGLDKGTTADLQEIYLVYFKHRTQDVQHNTLDLLAELPFSKASYEAFRPMIGYYINSMPKEQAMDVLNYIKTRTQSGRS